MGAAVAVVAVGAAAVAGGCYLCEQLFGPGAHPRSAPLPPTPGEVARLEEELQRLERLRDQIHAERQRLEEEGNAGGGAAAPEELRQRDEDLRQREEDLRRREESSLRQREDQLRREEEARNYPLQDYQEQADWEGSVNVGLVGNSGVGKSLLSNTIRRAQRGTPAWAAVGVTETTMQPTMYPYPDEPRARLWDLPGGGTAAFPREDYIRTVGLRHYDAVLVVNAGRFTETEILLLNELRQYGVPHFAVRTKIDVDIQNQMNDNGVDEEATKSGIVDDLRGNGVREPYLVNARAVSEHDFSKLIRDVHAEIVNNRRY